MDSPFPGIELLPRDEPMIFISNHRDITLDPILMNYALWLNGIRTTQVAVGDNLFAGGFETELMRINRSFVVVRSAKGVRAQYKALTRTSKYIRKTLDEGESIWIAQREGRTKDGLDRTETAILKMFMVAYRGEVDSIEDYLNRVHLVPTSLSYELDPCAPSKAREQYQKGTTGNYQKAAGEDRQSMITGITGFKGNIHVAFSSPLSGAFEDAEALGAKIDECILGNLQPFDTFRYAKQVLDTNSTTNFLSGRVKREFEAQLDSVSAAEKPFLLQQYANQWHQ